MSEPANRMTRYRDLLRENPGGIETLPEEDASVLRAVVDGDDIHQIAQDHRMSEAAAWSLIERAARAISGQGYQSRTETAGLGSDTDPGVTGGYGDTGFGSIGNDPPFPTPEEPQ